MADGTPFDGAIVLYRRIDAFADADQAASSTADIRALLERLANSSPQEVSHILEKHDFAALAVRVRDRIPAAARRALIAKLEVLSQGTSDALPLIIALRRAATASSYARRAANAVTATLSCDHRHQAQGPCRQKTEKSKGGEVASVPVANAPRPQCFVRCWIM